MSSSEPYLTPSGPPPDLLRTPSGPSLNPLRTTHQAEDAAEEVLGQNGGGVEGVHLGVRGGGPLVDLVLRQMELRHDQSRPIDPEAGEKTTGRAPPPRAGSGLWTRRWTSPSAAIDPARWSSRCSTAEMIGPPGSTARDGAGPSPGTALRSSGGSKGESDAGSARIFS
eukprot:1192673-Prorocentrum_minimum.AAC.2